MEVNERHDELSQKIFKMGNGLITEGTTKNDYIITNIGSFMVFLSGLIYDKDDVHLFSELCAMFSAKKVLDSQNDVLDKFGEMNEDEIVNIYNAMREDMINLDDTEDEDFDEDFDDEDPKI